jgi:hypothetical protein
LKHLSNAASASARRPSVGIGPSAVAIKLQLPDGRIYDQEGKLFQDRPPDFQLNCHFIAPPMAASGCWSKVLRGASARAATQA